MVHMNIPTFADSFQVLLLQAADNGRGPVLFGDSVARAREALPPFMVGRKFPSIYLEFPLMGDPFLDVTVLYSQLDPGTRIDSPAAKDAEPMLDWFAGLCDEYPNACCGFELDTKKSDIPAAAVHCQPRKHLDLVEPFCAAVGEPERAALYLDLAARMPEGWPLSYFGMFRGRPGSPLRVCGYLDHDEKELCAESPQYLADALDAAGFTAYDDVMLQQVTSLMAAAPGTVDFQFDIYPDGKLGNTFAIDIQFEIQQPEAVQSSFTDGPGARVMTLLERLGAADERWKLGIEATFARKLLVQLPDGSDGSYAFTVMPQWVKARWTDGVLECAKLYHSACATLLDKEDE